MARTGRFVKRLGRGTLAGCAGTCTLAGLISACERWLPHTVPGFEATGHIVMVQRMARLLPEAMRARLSSRLENAMGGLLAFGYGLMMAAGYSALRPHGHKPLVGGTLFGLGVWALGYLGWGPAFGCMPPPWTQKRAAVLGPVARHLAYGVVTAATYRWLQQWRDETLGTERAGRLK